MYIGTEQSDLLGGTTGNDDISALGGDDIITSGGGVDVVDGGAGVDTLTVDYSDATSLVTMTAPTPTGPVNVGETSPGNTAFMESGDAASGTMTATFTVASDGINHLWWGPGAIAAAMDGVVDAEGETMSLETTFTNGGQTATWTGSTTVMEDGSNQTVVYTKFTATLVSGRWQTVADLGFGGRPDPVVELLGTDFAVSYSFTASLDGITYQPFTLLYDHAHTQDNNGAVTSVEGQFIYEDNGVSGSVEDGGANSVDFADIENVILKAGSGGSKIATAAGADELAGGAGTDDFDSGAGSDYLSGGGGNDVLDGGDGIDLADYSEKTTAVIVQLAGASVANVKVGGVNEDTIVNIENIKGGSAADRLTGDAFVNTLTGNGGNDQLKGGAGADMLDGGSGSDTALYSDETLSVSVTLGTEVPVVVKIGGLADDTISFIENITSGSGNDRLTGDIFGNVLNGGAGRDILSGAGGLDTLIGGLGKDTLIGGASKDIFDFNMSVESAGAGFDTIADFRHGQGDRIDLSTLDAVSPTGANNKFHFLSADGASFKNAGDLHWFFKGHGGDWVTVVEGDTNGNGKADFHIELSGHIFLAAGDFIL